METNARNRPSNYWKNKKMMSEQDYGLVMTRNTDGIGSAPLSASRRHPMKSKRKLIMALLGLALFATPINALAYQRGPVARTNMAAPARNFARARSTAFSHPAAFRSFSNRNFPERSNTMLGARPFARPFQANPVMNNWKGNEFPQNYGGYGYNQAPGYGYAAPAMGMYGAGMPSYGGGEYAGGACTNVQRLQNQARRDWYTGHPAAAVDLLQRMRWAENRCGVGSIW
jgi:hypothetical protein